MTAQYIYAPEKGKLYDFFAVLNMSARFNRLEDAYQNIELKKDIANAYVRIRESIADHVDGLKIFWDSNNQSESFFYNLLAHELLKAESIDEVIEAFKSYDQTDLMIKLLSYYDKKNEFSDNFYKLLLDNKELLTEFLNGLELSADAKWEMMSFTKFPDSLIDKVLTLLYVVKNELDEEYRINKGLLNENYKKVEVEFKNKREKLLISDPSYNELLRYHSYAFIRFTVTLFTPYSIQYVCDNRNLNIYLGYEYEKMLNYYENEQIDSTIFFKSFTDNTRYNILKLLSQRELSAGDIGKELGVSPSSLSHHLNILSQANIVRRFSRGKRSLFTLNKDTVLLGIKELNKLANT